ncbi:MAG: hypothetical protein K2K17_02220 [Lachnospiraceae bacterium]|nr:hypothetical protein [Lachnospiraceae bacterium]
MIKKKNKFFTFIFSLLPGAGEMYMGFMKMGISLMCCFFLTLILADMGVSDFMVLIAVIVWFYSFFHVHNLAGLPDEMFFEVKDEYLLPFADKEEEKMMITGKYRKVAAVVLIVIGISGLLKSFYYVAVRYFPQEVRMIMNDFIFYYLPRVVFSIAVIVLGIYMIRGKKKQLDDESIQSQ